ncbi:MAG: hypothetical protein IH598_16875 [Bacteroidales bacterium]|nr:hypothetical protein [Bacteroidales bacterium]
MEENNQNGQTKPKRTKAAEKPEVAAKETIVENACRAKVKELISAQKNELDAKQIALEQMMFNLEELNQRRELAKRALKKAKGNKLGKKKLGLIIDDLKAIKEERKLLKQLIKSNTRKAEDLTSLILLLETIA